MSVEQRLRTDLHAVGESIHPDPWAALGEVETMATRQQTRDLVVGYRAFGFRFVD